MPVILTAWTRCPACGHTFPGTWAGPDADETQTCPACRSEHTARWAGWKHP